MYPIAFRVPIGIRFLKKKKEKNISLSRDEEIDRERERERERTRRAATMAVSVTCLPVGGREAFTASCWNARRFRNARKTSPLSALQLSPWVRREPPAKAETSYRRRDLTVFRVRSKAHAMVVYGAIKNEDSYTLELTEENVETVLDEVSF